MHTRHAATETSLEGGLRGLFCPHFIELESSEKRTEIEICRQSIMLHPPGFGNLTPALTNDV